MTGGRLWNEATNSVVTLAISDRTVSVWYKQARFKLYVFKLNYKEKIQYWSKFIGFKLCFTIWNEKVVTHQLLIPANDVSDQFASLDVIL